MTPRQCYSNRLELRLAHQKREICIHTKGSRLTRSRNDDDEVNDDGDNDDNNAADNDDVNYDDNNDDDDK